MRLPSSLGWLFIFFFSTLFGAEVPIDINLFDGVDGCFILFDLSKNQPLVMYNAELCQTRFSPCSTFKIANALIGLDAGILQDEATEFLWDGSKQPFEKWERNHTLLTAMQNSVVWYFRALAQKVGQETYNNYMARLHYGNEDISSGADNFWLEGSLLISPLEQIDFLNRLYRDELPASRQAMKTVRKVVLLETDAEYSLSGKTGTGSKDLGWFIGHLQWGRKEYTFATCLRGPSSTGAKAKAITKQILYDLGLSI